MNHSRGSSWVVLLMPFKARSTRFKMQAPRSRLSSTVFRRLRSVVEGKGQEGSGFRLTLNPKPRHMRRRKKTLKPAGAATTSSGETIGSAVANVAVVVGNRVVEPPKLKWNDLGGSLRDFAEDIGQDAMSVGEITLGTTTEVAEIAVTQAVTLAKTTLEHAKKTAEQGAKIAEAVGRFIADQARAFGEEVAKVGPLVAGLGQELWSEMMSFLNCVKPSTSLCQVLIGRECDCSAGSYVKVFTDRMEMRCVFSRTSEFSQGFGIKAMQDSTPAWK